jgi:FkbM family methyltransferase
MRKSNHRPIAFVLASTNHGTMLVNRHDYKHVEEVMIGVGAQILETSSFDQPEIDFALRLLKLRQQSYGDGVMAIDLGANIGVHTIEWAQFMTGWGDVIAVEAQERIFYALAGNIALNNCFNARAVWAAAGAANGHIGVPVPNYFSPSSFGSLEIRETKNNEFIGQQINYNNLQYTQMISIDEMKLNRVDLIKIDIEGMEVDALNGAKETIKRAKPNLIIERVKSNESEINEFLNNYGYKTFPLGFNLLAIHETDPLSSQIDIEDPQIG